MSAQIFQDIVVIGGMFFLRIGLPLLIVMGVGNLVRRWIERRSSRSSSRVSFERRKSK